jgi:hypothetical protein
MIRAHHSVQAAWIFMSGTGDEVPQGTVRVDSREVVHHATLGFTAMALQWKISFRTKHRPLAYVEPAQSCKKQRQVSVLLFTGLSSSALSKRTHPFSINFRAFYADIAYKEFDCRHVIHGFFIRLRGRQHPSNHG